MRIWDSVAFAVVLLSIASVDLGTLAPPNKRRTPRRNVTVFSTRASECVSEAC